MKRTAQLTVWLCLSLSATIAPARAQFKILHSFAGGAGDGAYPYGGSLIQSGPTLYGMTTYGGSSNLGTIFKIGLDGTGFSLLHSFASGGSDGYLPEGSLIQDGSTLYGMTAYDGSSDGGTVFKVGIDGTGYSLLHTFTGGASEGRVPYGSLIQSGSTLYGMTAGGGSGDIGTIFKIGTDGTGFSLLHSFTGGDGGSPNGSLIQSGSTLYGMTRIRGSFYDSGTVFQIRTDGTGFNLLHTFTGFSNGDGAAPYGSLLKIGPTLYGMTSSGGSGIGVGIIFSLVVPEPSTLALAALAMLGPIQHGRRRKS